MALFLILEIGWSWGPGKSFFFCLTIASVLLGATWVEKPLIDIFSIQEHGGGFDPFILKVASLVAVSIIIVYFVFVDNS